MAGDDILIVIRNGYLDYRLDMGSGLRWNEWRERGAVGAGW